MSSPPPPREGKRPGHPLTGEQSEEFRVAVADVAPIERPRRQAIAAPPPPPIPYQTRNDERVALAESLSGAFSIDEAMDTGEELVYLRSGLSRQLLRRLRRGDWVIQANLDLHGMNRFAAADNVAAFLSECVARGDRCVRIVHGKGLGSKNREPVLKAKLGKWLPARNDVLAFCQAPAPQGGSGALLVLLSARGKSG